MFDRFLPKLLVSAATVTLGFAFAVAPACAERMRTAWYGPGYHGNRTANGETFSRYAYTAAHPSWPFGTEIRVTNPSNGRSVTLRINDRSGGLLDVSEQAATELGFKRDGIAHLDVQIVRWGDR